MIRSLLKLAIVLACLFDPLQGIGIQAQAQGVRGSPWTPPTLFLEQADGFLQTPQLVTDSDGTLHAFWLATPSQDEPNAIYYRRWNGGGWSEPIDVLMSPDPADKISSFSVIEGSPGRLDLLWPSYRGFWHSSAVAAKAGVASAWSVPQMVAAEHPYSTPGLAVDGNRRLLLVFSPYTRDKVVFMVSSDGGANWSDGNAVHIQESDSLGVVYPSILVLGSGRLIISWFVFDNSKGIAGGYYVTSADDGQTWSAPQDILSPANRARLDATGRWYGGQIFKSGGYLAKVEFGGVGAGGREIAFSENGDTWTAPANVSLGGGEGFQTVSAVVDSQSLLRVLVQTNGAWALFTWNGTSWQSEQVVTEATIIECCTTPGQSTENASLVISEGNRLHVFIEEADRRIWYTTRLLPIPAAAKPPVRPEQTALNDAIATEARVATTSTSDPKSSAEAAQPPKASAIPAVNGAKAAMAPGRFPVLAVAVLPTALLILIVFFGQTLRHRA